MKIISNLALFILLLAGIQISAAALPAPFTREGNPALYQKLSTLAQANLQKLDKPLQRSYRALLTEHDDVIMAYLLAYEPDANLISAEPQAVESNYLEIVKLLQDKGTTHAPEFFLSYVADQTVSDERIEAYRVALLEDGLRDLLEGIPDEMELYRAVSQWCAARLKFQQTSGRDQSPLDITQKSILGRCEEMQILFVAAARTVGLPTRAASTPWWAHQDNNHAWAEVWLEGAWHYTGDMDAAYYPDQTWFSGMIDKTVLILADGSLPSADDEVLAQGRYEAVINSIRNYAGERSRRIKLQTVDGQGNPLAETAVGIMVYNWNMLRPLTFISTGKDGRYEFSAGRGAFYLAAAQQGRQALVLVPSGEEAEIDVRLVLTESALPDQDAVLAYPGNPFEWKKSPELWDAGVKLAKALWDSEEQSYSSRFSDYADSLQSAVAVASRGNYLAFQGFLKKYPEPSEDFLRYLLDDDPKFLWQASTEQLEALYAFFGQFDPRDYPAEDFRLLVSPSVFYEELPRPVEYRDGVPQLYPQSIVAKGDDPEKRLTRALKSLRKKYKVDGKKALKGLLPLEAALRQKYLSPYQYSILAVSVARANGIPAEFTRIPDLIYVRAGEEWRYYDIRKCAWETGDKGQAGPTFELTVTVSDELGIPLEIEPGQLALARWQDGQFYQLKHSFEPQDKGRYAVSLPRGDYYLQAGYRISDSRTAFQMRHIEGSQADELSCALSLAEYPRQWTPLEQDSELQAVLRELEQTGADCILIGNYDRENSLRTAERLDLLEQDFLWVGYESAPSGPANYRVSEAWKSLVARDQVNAVRTVTLVRKDSAWQVYEGLWVKLPE